MKEYIKQYSYKLELKINNNHNNNIYYDINYYLYNKRHGLYCSVFSFKNKNGYKGYFYKGYYYMGQEYSHWIDNTQGFLFRYHI